MIKVKSWMLSFSIVLFFSICLLSQIQAEENDNAYTALKNPHILIFKSKRLLQLFEGENLYKDYSIALGSNPIGPKNKQGDRATPEGKYFITHKNPRSSFYLSLGLNYPNSNDAKQGVINHLISQKTFEDIIKAEMNKKLPPQNTRLGGEIFIHGGGISRDWTWGCIALANEDINQLFAIVTPGTRVEIKP